ncbi:MAG: hypothetical protein M3393_02460 [Actinomycetota bacterium]|nr:hypothetical protein [Actinomycetota bacterium]
MLEHEARILCLAAHWANLHSGDALDSEGRVLPGMERSRQLGGPGTPRVQEFCTAEFGALQGVGYIAADNLQRDALDLQYRHPLLWAATVSTGTVRVWQAREVAKLAHVAGLSLEQAHWLDDQTTCRMGALPWGRFLALVEAKIIEADPTAAEARRVAAAMERFVRTGRSNEYGLKTIIAKAEAGDAIFFLAMCDRLTQILALRGDTDPVEVRRSKALGILANPIRAAALLHHYAQVQDDDPDTGNRAGPGDDEDAADDAGADDENDPDEVGEGDLHPAHNDADDPVCTGDPTAFVKPMTVDPRKLLPPATLYVHLSETSFTRAAAGVARFEGVGPITIDQACDFLQHCNVVVKPVIDVANQAPVDG